MRLQGSRLIVPEKVIIIDGVLQKVLDHATKTYPEECCGFLFGEQDRGRIQITDAKLMDNEAPESRGRRYLITAEGYLRGEKYADELRLPLVGVYHSHPDHPAQPSSYDLDRAFPGFVYLIVSVYHGVAREAKWWLFTRDSSGFIEMESTTNIQRRY
jgi:proteasome lid subunit RPN8/RPN11